MKEPAVSFQEVRRRFGATEALAGLDLEVPHGSVLGLVGRNGAGKTTALRLALGLLHPDAGAIRVLGLDPVHEGRAVRERVGFLAEETALVPWMRVEEAMSLAASLSPRWDEDLARDLRRRLDLDPAVRIDRLSRGNRAKTALVLAAATRPEVLLLDDPTASLDPLARREVLEGILETIPGEGGAVVYASHLIDDIERVADRVAVLDAGRVVLEGELERLRSRMRRVTAVLEKDVPTESWSGVLHVRREGRLLEVVCDGAHEETVRILRESGGDEIEIEAVTLEEVLVACLRAGRDRPSEASHE